MDKVTLMTHVKMAIDDMSKTKVNGTYLWYLGTDNNNNDWAIVLGWQNGFDDTEIDNYSDGEYRLCIKLAYQSNKCITQSDFNIDWLLPCDDNGEINDTEIPIYNDTNINIAVDWLLNQFQLYACEW